MERTNRSQKPETECTKFEIKGFKENNKRKENDEIKYLRPDSKSQVTIEYDKNNKPLRIDTIVISTQHDDFDEEKYPNFFRVAKAPEIF